MRETGEQRDGGTVERRGVLRQGAGLLAGTACVSLLAACRPGRHPGPHDPPVTATTAAPPGGTEPPAGGDGGSVTLPRSVAGVAIPDSRLARAAATLAHTASPANLYNHVIRSYLFAALLFERRGTTTYDRELAFVACALHDLGLLEAYWSPMERFEVDGADAARRFLEQWKVPAHRIEVVWDAIALHTSLSIATRKAPEVAMVSLGAVMDTAGLNLDQVPPGAVDAVLAEFPRLGFKQSVVETILLLCRRKPFGQLMHPFAEVGRRHLPDFAVPTIEDLALGAPFAE